MSDLQLTRALNKYERATRDYGMSLCDPSLDKDTVQRMEDQRNDARKKVEKIFAEKKMVIDDLIDINRRLARGERP